MAGNKQKILIVGDWFVDEYWFLARHHSTTSRHTGPLHYRIISKKEESVRDLCGAGVIARMLYQLRKYDLDSTNAKTKFQECLEQCAIRQDVENAINSKNTENAIDENSKNIKISKPDVIFDAIWRTVRDTSCDNKIKKYYLSDDFLHSQIDEPIFEKLDKQYYLHGLGHWHEDDTETLKHLVHARCLGKEGAAASASFCLEQQHCKHAVDIHLQSLNAEHSTIRIIRPYRVVGNDFEQLNRIDWEPSEGEDHTSFSSDKIPKNVDAIIIEDHNKNRDLPDLIKELAKKNSNAKWYIRTRSREVYNDHGWFERHFGTPKNRLQKWFECHRGAPKNTPKDIDLLVAGHEIACASYPIGGLLIDHAGIAAHAYELIDKIFRAAQRSGITIKNIVLVSDKRENVAAHNLQANSEGIASGECLTATMPVPAKHRVFNQVNWTTAFYGALAYEMISSGESPSSPLTKSGDPDSLGR
jgi:hypothetical protein